jgi:hypothetical protein
MGTSVQRRWHPVEKVLFTIFFMLLSKREMHVLISPTSLAPSGTDPHKSQFVPPLAYMEFMVVVTKGTPN